MEAIRENNQPMTVHEIERWIQAHEPALSDEIGKKCSDYTRIILALAPASTLSKYRSTSLAPGVDPRSSFYGLPAGQYAGNWVRDATSKKRSCAKESGRRSRNRRRVRPPPFVIDAPPTARPYLAFAPGTDSASATEEAANTLPSFHLGGIETARPNAPSRFFAVDIGATTVQRPLSFEEAIALVSRGLPQKDDLCRSTDILDNSP
jgi:hypothetical protein